MSRGFQLRRGGPSAVFAPVEAAVLRDLLTQLLDLLGPARVVAADEDPLVALTGLTGLSSGDAMDWAGTNAPSDPVLARLLPAASRDDPTAAAEFRRLTEVELRDGKRQAAHIVLTMLAGRGGRVTLERELAELWLGVLNDLRLALGTRLEVTQDDDPDEVGPAPNEGDPDPEQANRLMALNVYHWLGFLQGTLLQAMEA